MKVFRSNKKFVFDPGGNRETLDLLNGGMEVGNGI